MTHNQQVKRLMAAPFNCTRERAVILARAQVTKPEAVKVGDYVMDSMRNIGHPYGATPVIYRVAKLNAKSFGLVRFDDPSRTHNVRMTSIRSGNWLVASGHK